MSCSVFQFSAVSPSDLGSAKNIRYKANRKYKKNKLKCRKPKTSLVSWNKPRDSNPTQAVDAPIIRPGKKSSINSSAQTRVDNSNITSTSVSDSNRDDIQGTSTYCNSSPSNFYSLTHSTSFHFCSSKDVSINKSTENGRSNKQRVEIVVDCVEKLQITLLRLESIGRSVKQMKKLFVQNHSDHQLPYENGLKGELRNKMDLMKTAIDRTQSKNKKKILTSRNRVALATKSRYSDDQGIVEITKRLQELKI